jgi:oligopeptide/dipeptide ABC transporter ATP-binding protein
MDNADLLSIENLFVSYGNVPILRDVSIAVRKGEIIGIVGESGSGKSTLISAVMGILGKNGTVDAGKIGFDGTDLLTLNREALRRVRGRQIALISQNPMAAFSPVRKIKAQLHEAVRCHNSVSKYEAEQLMLELLAKMKLPNGKRILNSFAFEMSGGMCQRASIAMAMVMHPDLLFADEPTSALDVMVQAQVIGELMKLREEYGISIVIVSHNMGVISHMVDKVVVMYAGVVLECGNKRDIMKYPAHPYTKNIISAIPQLNAPAPKGVTVGISDRRAEGCVFKTGCPYCDTKCERAMPEWRELENGHFIRCFHV